MSYIAFLDSYFWYLVLLVSNRGRQTNQRISTKEIMFCRVFLARKGRNWDPNKSDTRGFWVPTGRIARILGSSQGKWVRFWVPMRGFWVPIRRFWVTVHSFWVWVPRFWVPSMRFWVPIEADGFQHLETNPQQMPTRAVSSGRRNTERL